MTFKDTYKYGLLYVDAAGTIARLDEEQRAFHDGEDCFGEVFPGETREHLRAFEESAVEFEFDEDYPHGSMYRNDDQRVPLILLGHFGGYPGESIDRANADAAKAWAHDRSLVYSFSSMFGGCEMVSLYFVIDEATEEDEVTEAIEMVAEFREYPILNEDLWSQYENEVWQDLIDEMISDYDEARSEIRPDVPELTEDQKHKLRESADEFMGHWDEGYFDQEEWDKIVKEVIGE